MAENNLRQRAQKKRIQVTFPDGKVICYRDATTTLIETLKLVGSDRFPEIELEIGHLPIMSKVIHKKFGEEYMKPVCDGWYVNIQSDTSQKYLQLVSINDKLNLGLTIKLGTDFEFYNEPTVGKARIKSDSFFVRFPDGKMIASELTKDTYFDVLREIGLPALCSKEFEALGKRVVTRYQKYPNQIQDCSGYWITLPNSNKDRIKVLNSISTHLRLDLEVKTVANMEQFIKDEQANQEHSEKLEKIHSFIKECGTYFLATVDGDQPRVRPFGTIMIFEGRLYLQTGYKKAVAKQIGTNPKFELCCFKDGEWLRVSGTLVEDGRTEPKRAMLDAYPELRSMYNENDDNTAVFWIMDGTAKFCSFTNQESVVEI